MKWFRKSPPRCGLLVLMAAALLWAGLAARADLPDWIRRLDSKDPLRSVFFRLMALPSGQILLRRPPAESRLKLSERIKRSPSDAHL